MTLSFRLLTLAALATSVGCSHPKPSTRTTPEMAIAASADRTWNALIDFVNAQQLPIGVVERTSGLLQTGDVSLATWSHVQRAGYADCGSAAGLGREAALMSASFVVRGDSTRSTVRADAHLRRSDGTPCSSYGIIEAEWEKKIRDRAEGKAAP
jgi:hypothetical protein